MYSLVRRYIKTAIGFLIVGLVIGGWMIVRREFRQQFPTPYETSAHTHAIFVGFVMMMICGVALWLFPRPGKADRRYRPAFAEAAYWMLAVGTSVRIGGELMRNMTAARWLSVAIVGGGMLQILGLGLFLHDVVSYQARRQPVTRGERRALLTA
jgi:heme/copper-type cytochrome/quinol oxidase subunit 1